MWPSAEMIKSRSDTLPPFGLIASGRSGNPRQVRFQQLLEGRQAHVAFPGLEDPTSLRKMLDEGWVDGLGRVGSSELVDVERDATRDLREVVAVKTEEPDDVLTED